MPLVRRDPALTVFSDPDLSGAAAFLYSEKFVNDYIRLSSGLYLDAPLKGMRGTSSDDPNIMLSTIRVSPDAIMYDEEIFDILYAVVRSQAQLIRENIGNPADNFPLALESLYWSGNMRLRFRSPRFAHLIDPELILGSLSMVDDMGVSGFKASFIAGVNRQLNSPHESVDPSIRVKLDTTLLRVAMARSYEAFRRD